MRIVCKHSAPALTHRSHAGNTPGLLSVEKFAPDSLTQRSLWPRQRSQALLRELMLLLLFLSLLLFILLLEPVGADLTGNLCILSTESSKIRISFGGGNKIEPDFMGYYINNT